ncbi:MAG TPA: hypothetical protein VHM30_09215 [Gemmatimonadaceae bacterium]|nr:hypothetical protein [Gemmatimonadaceae bacterium]
MKHLRLAALVAALVIAPTTACYRTTRTTGAQDQPTWVRVENRSFTDATVYVWQSSQRLRLGYVTATSSQTMELPRSIIFGPTPLRFSVDFLAGNRSPISESITVIPGDTVVLEIPPGA